MKLAIFVLLPGILGGCGLQMTSDPPPYDDLSAHEKQVVDIVLAELKAFNKHVEKRTKFSIATVLHRENINVAFKGKIFTYNLGNGIIHIPVWENLTGRQRALTGQWWAAPSEAKAEVWFKKLFYRFMAVAQGVKQYMFEAITAKWVFAHRTLYNIERDSVRAALSHFVAEGRQKDLWPFVTNLCKPVLKEYGANYAHLFKDQKVAKQYMTDHFSELADPTAPTGYMYFLCQWVTMGQMDATPLSTELKWLKDLPLP